MAKSANLNIRIDPDTKNNAETEAAMQEASLIASGKTPAKGYLSAHELFEEIDAEC